MSPIDVETAAPEGRMSPPFRRWLAILVGIAAIAVPVLTFVEADAGRKEEQDLRERGAGCARHLRPDRR